MLHNRAEDTFTLYGHNFASRLLLGTARYESPLQLADAIRVANPALLTVSVRRQLPSGHLGSQDPGKAFWALLRDTGRNILPNTAGCHTVRDAVNTARMARELFETNIIKLEVIGDEASLQPDPFGLVEAATELVRLGFQVLPYCTEDWVLCRRLHDAGCEVLMPWAAPIGTGQGTTQPGRPARITSACARRPSHHRCGHWPSFSRLPGYGVGLRWSAVEYGHFAQYRSGAHGRCILGQYSGGSRRVSCRPNGRTDNCGAEHPRYRQAICG